MDISLLLFEEEKMKIVGGIVGDAIENTTTAIWEGIVYGFKYVCLVTTNVICNLTGLATVAQETVYFASHNDSDKGKIMKYLIIYLGACSVGWLISAI